MADQPKKTGVYDTPGSTSTKRGASGAIPPWVWIVAVIVVLAILGMMFL